MAELTTSDYQKIGARIREVRIKRNMSQADLANAAHISLAKLEEQIAELDKLAESYSTDYEKLMEIDSEKEGLNDKLLEAYEAWEVFAE